MTKRKRLYRVSVQPQCSAAYERIIAHELEKHGDDSTFIALATVLLLIVLNIGIYMLLADDSQTEQPAAGSAVHATQQEAAGVAVAENRRP